MSPGKAPSSGLDGDEAARFFALLENASNALLLLDYDGTLAPFREDPAEALPYPEVVPLLRAIAEEGSTRVVIVSGRSLESLLPLLDFGALPEIWGSHGRERCLAGGEVRQVAPSEVHIRGLSEARETLEGADIPGRLEEKPFSLAFHVRGLPKKTGEESLARAHSLWEPFARRAGLNILPFNGGLEICAPGWNKGDAVNVLLESVPEGTPAAYLGDDETDEDAFRSLEGRGLPVLVREERRASLARVWLHPPDELAAFLERWRAARLRAGLGGRT